MNNLISLVMGGSSALAGDQLYWVESGEIRRVGVDGSNLTDILTGLDSPRGIAFLPLAGGVVPAVSTWGSIGLVCLLLVTSTIVLLRRRGRASS